MPPFVAVGERSAARSSVTVAASSHLAAPDRQSVPLRGVSQRHNTRPMPLCLSLGAPVTQTDLPPTPVRSTDESDDDPFRWLWLSEAAAEHYGGKSTLRGYITAGRLPTAEKLGKGWRVRKYDLDNLVEKRAVAPSFEDVETAMTRILAQAPPMTDGQMCTLGQILIEQLQRNAVAA
jgi:Helix-turn-helix domain